MKSVVRGIKERGGKPAGQGETQEGPPFAQAHLDLPVPTPLCPSPQSSSTQLLRTGQRSEPPRHRQAWDSGLGPRPTALSASPGVWQAPGLRDCPAWGCGWASLLVPLTTTSLSRSKFVLASLSPHFGVLWWAPNSCSFSIPAPVLLMCLSLDPEHSSSQRVPSPTRDVPR